MSTANACRCVGPFCRCTGSEILKDGHRTSLRGAGGVWRDAALPATGRMMMTDGASEPSPSDRAYAQMCHDLQTAWQGGVREVRDAAPAAPISLATEVHDHAYAEARAAGLDDAAARNHAAREAMIHDQANAWRGR